MAVMTPQSDPPREAPGIVDAVSKDDESAVNSDPTSVRRHAVDVVLALADQVFISLTTFVTMILVAKWCGTADLNVYVLAWSVLNFFRVIQERALAAAYVVYAHETGRDSVAFLGSSLAHQGLFGIATAAAFVLLAAVASVAGGPDGLATSLLVLAIASPLVLLRDHLRAISCTHFRYGVAVMLSGSALLIQLMVMFAFHRIDQLNAGVVFAAMGLSSLVPSLVWLKLRPQPYQLDRQQVRTDWRTTFQYSRWLVAARFFPSVASSLLPWIVLWLISEDAAGIWGACMTLANVGMMFITGSNNLFQPRAVRALHRHGKSAMTRILSVSAAFFAAALSVLCLVFFWFGGPLLGLVFEPSFAEHGIVVAILGLNVLLVSFSMVAGNGMAALEKPRGIFLGELTWSIVSIGAAVWLTSMYGLVGTAIALCLASLAATVLEGGWLILLLNQQDDAGRAGGAF